MKIAISAESTLDLTKELILENDIKVIPFQVLLGDNTYLDGEISPKEIFKFVEETKVLPKTAAVNEYRFDEYFGDLLKEYDAVIHFSLSSEISCTYTNAVNSSKNFKNVYVVDTKSLSTGIALLCLYAKRLANENLLPKEIYEKCLERVDSLQVSFVLDRLDYLYKGGRCSALSLLGANIFHIRPQIIVKDGKMIAGKKFRGNLASVVDKYVEDVLSTFNTPDLSNVFITYTTAESETVNKIRQKLIERGFVNIYETTAGATITSHCGENCLGILYINDGQK